MKVRAGESKGRNIVAPKGRTLRVTSDRVKESLFNILHGIDGKTFLDIFAGSGNIGIEARSRGAKMVVFVEKRPLHIETIRTNVKRCLFEKESEIIKATFEKGISLLAERGLAFDIVFADPPYNEDYVARTVNMLGSMPIIAKGGVVVVEHSTRESCEGSGNLVVYDRRKYGDTALTFLKTVKKEENRHENGRLSRLF